MVDNNNTSRCVWMYEGTPRTIALDDATDQTYYFGLYNTETDSWNTPEFSGIAIPSTAYNSSTPTLADGGLSLKPFKHTWNASTAHHMVWMLGKCTDAATDTFEPKAYNEEQYPIDIRFEEGGGTNERFVQLNTAFMTELYVCMEANKPYLVEGTFEYESISDNGDYNQLTQTPVNAGGSGVIAPFFGYPTVIYDYGGGGAYTLPEIYKAEFSVKCNRSVSLGSTRTTQTVYKDRFEPVDLILSAVTQVDTFWDDFIDRATGKEIRITAYKPNGSYYIHHDFTNIMITGVARTGKIFKGYMETKLVCKAEKVAGSHVTENVTNHDTHYKGVVT